MIGLGYHQKLSPTTYKQDFEIGTSLLLFFTYIQLFIIMFKMFLYIFNLINEKTFFTSNSRGLALAHLVY